MAYRVSAKEVADLAGVSRAAVSRTFGKGVVSAEMRERVIAAADTLGYRPNAIARSLIGGRSGLVAVVVAESDSLQNSLLIERLVVAITNSGKRALVIPATPDADLDQSTLNASDYQVDAIVVVGGTVSSAIIERLSKAEVPLFLYERLTDAPGVECVIFANDPTVLGGALTPYVAKKWMRALEIARDNRIPYVSFVESAGADLRVRTALNAETKQDGRTSDMVFSVAEIIAELRGRFPDVPGIDEDILAFMEVAHAQFWIELH